MALSQAEKDEIVEMLEGLDRRRRQAILDSENSFMGWIRKAASWLFDKIMDSIVGRVLSWLAGIFT